MFFIARHGNTTEFCCTSQKNYMYFNLPREAREAKRERGGERSMGQ
jgi:hypothetical protein